MIRPKFLKVGELDYALQASDDGLMPKKIEKVDLWIEHKEIFSPSAREPQLVTACRVIQVPVCSMSGSMCCMPYHGDPFEFA